MTTISNKDLIFLKENEEDEDNEDPFHNIQLNTRPARKSPPPKVKIPGGVRGGTNPVPNPKGPRGNKKTTSSKVPDPKGKDKDARAGTEKPKIKKIRPKKKPKPESDEQEKLKRLDQWSKVFLENIGFEFIKKGKLEGIKQTVPLFIMSIKFNAPGGGFKYMPLPDDKELELIKKNIEDKTQKLQSFGKGQRLVLKLAKLHNSNIPNWKKAVQLFPQVYKIVESLASASETSLQKKAARGRFSGMTNVGSPNTKNLNQYSGIMADLDVELQDLVDNSKIAKNYIGCWWRSSDAKNREEIENSFISFDAEKAPSAQDCSVKEEIQGKVNEKLTNFSKNDIKTLIKEAFVDSVYGKYPYSHKSGDENEHKEDYMEDWKAFCLEMARDETRQKAIKVAKLLIRDLELFEDVLDIAGQNQSIGSEILRKFQQK